MSYSLRDAMLIRTFVIDESILEYQIPVEVNLILTRCRSPVLYLPFMVISFFHNNVI